MAVEASGKLNVSHEFDDEDGPVIFKRSNTASKKNQLHSEVKKSTSHSLDGQSYRKTSDVPSSNGQNSGLQKGKIVSSAKASPTKSSVGLSKASTSHAYASYMKSPVANSKSSLSGDKSKPFSEHKMLVDVKEEKDCIKRISKDNSEDSEDEEDNKPLSARLKMNSNHTSKATPVVKKPDEDSDDDDDDDDDLPLSSRIVRNVGTPSSKNNNSDQKKHLLNIEHQDGSSARIKLEKPSTVSVKRPLDKSNSLHSSAKKPKLSDPASSMKSKLVSVKPARKVVDDDDDHVPISQRLTKSSASGNKLLSTKKIEKSVKVNKAGSTSFKKQIKKSKKISNNSEYSKSTKLLPSSGDGQKKWTTLVHNGVIFPPPYQPHGVKMLYKGKPVDLTPVQEEV